jgi:pimeloyl-ACP methyl ester carboxylesterase
VTVLADSRQTRSNLITSCLPVTREANCEVGILIRRTRVMNLLRIVGILGFASLLCAQSAESNATSAAQLGSGFESKFAQANGTRLHYVRGGSGPALILLHGFPEDWYEFRLVMPRLAKRFTVLAVDLRGVGESAPAETGYDAANMAEDIHQFILSLGLERVSLFGHDIGGMVAYAYARRYPQSARGVMILDVAFPGLDPWQQILSHPAFWHVRFHQTTLLEKLVYGRQAEYFWYFLSQFSDEDLNHYAYSYRDPDHLRAAFETYRAVPANEKFFVAQGGRMDLPIVIGSGEHDAFAEFVPRIAAAMRQHGCANLTTETVRGGAHYGAEKSPTR